MKVSLIMVSPGSGGLQQSLVSQANALAQQGHCVHVIASASSPLLRELDPAQMRVDEVRDGLLAKWHFRSIAKIHQSVRIFAPDVAIGFGQYGYPQARIALRGRLPLLSCCGSLNPRTIRMFRSANGFLATTIDMERLAHVMGVQNIYRLPYCVLDRPINKSIRKPHRLRIGAIGRFDRRKGFDVLVEAAAILKSEGCDFDLSIAGDGVDAGFLKALANQHGLPINFPGWLDSDKKNSFYDGLDIFVCPSRHEPFGIILLEALQAGVAVVSTNTSGAREVFATGGNGLVIESENPHAMAGAIKRLMQDSVLRGDVAEKGKATFDQNYSTRVVGARMTGILEDVISRYSSVTER